MAAGLYHSAVVSSEGVHAFGANATLCLSGDLDSHAFFPTRIPSLPPRVVQVSVAGDLMGAHSLAVTSQGRLFAWGCAKACGLGHVRGEVVEEPSLVTEFLREDDGVETSCPERVVFASAGGSCSAVITAEGALFTFGITACGRLGFRGRKKIQWRPRRVDALIGDTVRAVSAGGAHMLCVTSRGQLLVWGENSRGQLGLGDLKDRSSPTRVFHPSHGVWSASVAAGEGHSLAVDTTGRLYAWGACGAGALGQGCSAATSSAMSISFQLDSVGHAWTVPCQVASLADFRVTKVAAGAGHSVALTSEGMLFVWGAKDQVGHRLPVGTVSVPRLLAPSAKLPSVQAAAVAAGSYHTLLALKSPGRDSPSFKFLIDSLVRPVPCASHDAFITARSGQRLWISASAIRSRSTVASWRAFWLPQIEELGERLDSSGGLGQGDSSPLLIRMSELAVAFHSLDGEGSEGFNDGDTPAVDPVACILDEWVDEPAEAPPEIPRECLFANLEVETIQLFFELLLSDALPRVEDERQLELLLPLAIVSQNLRGVVLLQVRLGMAGACGAQPVPPPTLTSTLLTLHDKSLREGEVTFTCGAPSFRDLLSFDQNFLIRAHTFFVEANCPGLVFPAGDVLADGSPARLRPVKGFGITKTGNRSLEVCMPNVPVDVMRELVHFFYLFHLNEDLAHLENEFEDEDEMKATKFWLTVASVADQLGCSLAKAAAIDRVVDRIRPDNWVEVHAASLRLRVSARQLTEPILAMATSACADLVTSHKSFFSPNGYIFTKPEVADIVDKVLNEKKWATLTTDENCLVFEKVRTAVVRRISAHLNIARELRKKLDHLDGLNVDVVGEANLIKGSTVTVFQSILRSLKAMSVPLRGGPSLSATLRDLTLLGIVVGGLAIYLSSHQLFSARWSLGSVLTRRSGIGRILLVAVNVLLVVVFAYVLARSVVKFKA